MGVSNGNQRTHHDPLAGPPRGEDVCNQARFEDAVGIFPEFIDGHSSIKERLSVAADLGGSGGSQSLSSILNTLQLKVVFVRKYGFGHVVSS